MKKSFYILLFALYFTSCKKDTLSPDDSFTYTGALGDIIRIVEKDSLSVAEIQAMLPSEISSLVTINNGVYSYIVEYKSVNKDGDTVKASGSIFVPMKDSFALALVSYQHGTVLQKSDAPSIGRGSEYLLTLALAGADAVVTCVPDYLGLGTGDGLHLYLNPREEANSVRDLMRCVRKLVARDKIAHLNGQVFLFGYSQGGHATMAAQRQLEKENPKEFKLVASAPMAGPYALSRTTQFDVMLDSTFYPNPFYLPYLAVSLFHATNVFDTYNKVFKHPYDSLIPEIIDGYHSAGYANASFPYYVSNIVLDSMRTAIKNDPNHPIRLAAKEYDLVDDWTPTTPMRLYHCHGDDNVFFDNAVYADSVFRLRGTDIELIDVGDSKHEACAPPAMLFARGWFSGLVRYDKIK